MTLTGILDTLPPWLENEGPGAGIGVFCYGGLSRNFADFAFPAQCTQEEKAEVEQRVVQVLDRLGMFSHGFYVSLSDLSPLELRVLAERRLVPYELLCATGPRGVYITEDQRLTISVNGEDHLLIQAFETGLQLKEAWAHLNLLDDTLSNVFDYAFNERLGFLTTQLAQTGTALRAGAVLHLPALTWAGRMEALAEDSRKQGGALVGIVLGGDSRLPDGIDKEAGEQSWYNDLSTLVGGAVADTLGDLYHLRNTVTLGVSEDELIFHLNHTASTIVAEEEQERQRMWNEERKIVEDRVGRAQGLTANAQLLDFEEGLSLLSSLRLGVESDFLHTPSVAQLNRLLIAGQGAHLQQRYGQEENALAAETHRAQLFQQTIGTV